MVQKDSTQDPAMRSSGSLAAALETSANQRVAKVLERFTASVILPDSVQLGDRQVDTAQYIAELSEVARHNGTWSEKDTASL
jgi:hypothetical protein